MSRYQNCTRHLVSARTRLQRSYSPVATFSGNDDGMSYQLHFPGLTRNCRYIMAHSFYRFRDIKMDLNTMGLTDAPRNTEWQRCQR